MGKRRKRRKRIGIVLKIAAAFVLIAAAGVIWWHFRAPPESQGVQEFFSDDDGTSWFADDGTKLAPWDHNGKQAVLAKVYQTKAGKPFVAYLMKFTDKARDELNAQKNSQLHSGPIAAKGIAENPLLVKRPRDKEWVPVSDPKAREIMTVKPPGGTKDYTSVLPGR